MSKARDQYLGVYHPVNSIAGEDGLQNVFGDGSNKHASPLVTRTPRVIMTGADPSTAVITSFDAEFLEFLMVLRKRIDEEFEPKLTPEEFSINGVHTTADRLGCVAGYMMNPMSYTAVDNTRYRVSLGLLPGYSARQRAIAEEVWRLVLSEWHATDVNVPKLSTGGAIRFTSDPVWKADLLNMVIEPSEFENMLRMVAAKDWDGLARDYEQVYMTYIQTRNQNESIKKERTVFDLEYARTGGRSGRAFPADKSVAIAGRQYPELSATRARVIHAGPWAINGVLQIMFSGVMKSLFNRWPDVFHVTTGEQLERLCNGHYVYCGDVTEYDRSMSEDALEVAHKCMAEVWDPRIVAMSMRLIQSPYYSRPLSLEGGRGVFVGDPRDWNIKYNCGNRSGHAGTSVFAKVNKIIDDACVIDAAGYDVLGRVRELLEGKLPIKIINNGDDCVAYTTSQVAMKRFEAKRSDLHAGHYVVKREVGAVYSGFMLVQPNPNELTYVAERRLLTPLEKTLVPERSAGSTHRRFAPVGMLDRVINMSTYNRNGAHLHEVFMDTWRSTGMSYVYGDYINLISTALSGLPVMFDSLSFADKEVLEEPERIHYKWLPEEINPEVLKLITSKVPYEVFKHIPASYYNGKIVEGTNRGIF